MVQLDMKKILLTVTTLFGGGAERVVSVWANKLVDAGCDVSILLYGRSKNEYSIDSRVNVYTVAPTYRDFQEMTYISRLKKMRKLIKLVSPDVMINFLPRMQIWMMFASFGMNLKRIETVRVNPWVVCRNSWIEKKLWQYCFRRSDKIILQTEEQGYYFGKKDRCKGVVIPNPIDNVYYDSYVKHYSDKCINFIAAGRLTAQKNFPMLIDSFAKALKKNNQIQLKIFGIGDESYTKNLQHQIDELHMGGNIHLMGRSNCMSKEYTSADAFVLSSYFEGMPNALVEAMASGLVCISTDCKTGPRDMIIDGECGFLVNVNDSDSLAEKILEVSLMNREKRIMLGQNARKRIMSICSETKSLRKLMSAIES